MTFLEWCRDQTARRDAVGDFARDWVADRERPRAPSRLRMLEYLDDCGAIEAAVRAALRCYNEWRIYSPIGRDGPAR